MDSYDSSSVLSLESQIALLYQNTTTRGLRFSEGRSGRVPDVQGAA